MNTQMNIGAMLNEQLSKLLAEEVTAQSVLNAEKGIFPSYLWTTLSELGLFDLMLPEKKGGAELTWQDVLPVIKSFGEFAVPLPVIEMILAKMLLAETDIELSVAPIAIIQQPIMLKGNDLEEHIDVIVKYPEQCRFAIGIAELQGDARLVVFDLDGLDGLALTSYSREPVARKRVTSAQIHSISTLPQSWTILRLKAHLAIMTTALMSGACDRITAITLDYANTRAQFGRPISKFQVIQHYLAQLSSEAAACFASGIYASRLADNNNPIHGAMVGKTRAGDSASQVSQLAHQIFAAIGFTEEHELHNFTRRLWHWRAEYGSSDWWAEQLGSKVFNSGQSVWETLSEQ